MRVCIDLDGTICSIKQEGQTYSDVIPNPGVKEMLNAMKARGYTIVIHTARNMHSQGHNVGKVLKNVGRVTLEWLDRHEIPYDEIYFGKPNADITIDDRCIRFDGWDKISIEMLQSLAKGH